MLVGGAAVALGLVLVLPSAAGADTAPPLTCGNTQPGPCQQTLHYSTDDEVGSPLPPGRGCPDALANDFVHIVGQGNGIEHINVNKAQDAWFTSTFTGTVTITSYPPSSVTVDDQGNATIVGPPDANVPIMSGHFTEWFGGSFNNKNATSGGTVNLSVSGGGTSLKLHANMHSNWAVGSDLSGPPTRSFSNVVCS
jgi:hypothetical protein